MTSWPGDCPVPVRMHAASLAHFGGVGHMCVHMCGGSSTGYILPSFCSPSGLPLGQQNRYETARWPRSMAMAKQLE